MDQETSMSVSTDLIVDTPTAFKTQIMNKIVGRHTQ